MKSDFFNDRSIPLLFFITILIAYGLLLPETGFYWDDWPFAWTAKFLGSIFEVRTSLIPPVLIDDAFAMDKGVRQGLCQVWKRIQASGPVGSVEERSANQILSRFQCVP